MHTATAELSTFASGMLRITLSCKVDAGPVPLSAYQAKYWRETEGCLLQACVCLNPLAGLRLCCTCVVGAVRFAVTRVCRGYWLDLSYLQWSHICVSSESCAAGPSGQLCSPD